MLAAYPLVSKTRMLCINMPNKANTRATRQTNYQARPRACRVSLSAPISSDMQWNVAFDYPSFLTVLCFFYPPLFWQLYSHMLKQRYKKLVDAKKKEL